MNGPFATQTHEKFVKYGNVWFFSRSANKIPLADKMENYDYSQKHFIRINKQGAE